MAKLLESLLGAAGRRIVKCNGTVNQFPVNKAFHIIHCWILQLLLYLLIFFFM